MTLLPITTSAASTHRDCREPSHLTHPALVLHVAGGAAGDLVPVQAADDVERHVDTGGDPGGGDDLAFVDNTRVGQDVGRRRCARNPSIVVQCVVARRPSNRPAAPSRKAPVQTLVVKAPVRRCRAIQSRMTGFSCSRRVP